MPTPMPNGRVKFIYSIVVTKALRSPDRFRDEGATEWKAQSRNFSASEE